MKATIDLLNATTGWTPGAGSTINAYAVNQIQQFISGLNAGSLVLQIPAGNLGKAITKTINFDFTGYEEVTLSLWSRNENGKGMDYHDTAEFSYTVDFGTGDVYYLPVPHSFDDITLNIKGLGAVTSITITALTNDTDYLILSNMVASTDEMPVDIFQGIKEQMTNDMNAFYARIASGVTNKGILIGTVSGTAGDNHINFMDSLKFVDRYATIYIDDGANSETHQMDENDETSFLFTPLYNGLTLKYSHTSASLYLQLPTDYGMTEKEFLLPGITIWGMAPAEVNHMTKVESDFDTFKSDGTVQERLSPVNFKYQITIECAARHNSLLAIMSQVIRRMVAREYFWVNGKKINFRNPQMANYIDVSEGFNDIPRIQYVFDVEIKEEVYDRTVDVPTVTNNHTYNIKTSYPVGAV